MAFSTATTSTFNGHFWQRGVDSLLSLSSSWSDAVVRRRRQGYHMTPVLMNKIKQLVAIHSAVFQFQAQENKLSRR